MALPRLDVDALRRRTSQKKRVAHLEGPVKGKYVSSHVPLRKREDASGTEQKVPGVGVLRTLPSVYRWKRCFTHDEGRSLEVGVQAQTSNRGKRRRSRVVVVSVAGKGGAALRQVRIKKTNASEPLMLCRKDERDVETGLRLCSAKQVEGNLSTAPLVSGRRRRELDSGMDEERRNRSL